MINGDPPTLGPNAGRKARKIGSARARRCFRRARACPLHREGANSTVNDRHLGNVGFKCKACEKQFSVTSGTLFSSRKLPMRDYLLAIAIFVNGAKGVSALRLSRDLDCQYKTAFVLAHKLREAMASEHKSKVLRGHHCISRHLHAYAGGMA
jgi:transposase-like protein